MSWCLELIEHLWISLRWVSQSSSLIVKSKSGSQGKHAWDAGRMQVGTQKQHSVCSVDCQRTLDLVEYGIKYVESGVHQSLSSLLMFASILANVGCGCDGSLVLALMSGELAWSGWMLATLSLSPLSTAQAVLSIFIRFSFACVCFSFALFSARDTHNCKSVGFSKFWWGCGGATHRHVYCIWCWRTPPCSPLLMWLLFLNIAADLHHVRAVRGQFLKVESKG